MVGNTNCFIFTIFFMFLTSSIKWLYYFEKILVKKSNITIDQSIINEGFGKFNIYSSAHAKHITI